ncbi:hypothetical protein EJ03DRAFT_376732 [Teratosphaeria nubilosa]|uniref:Uncharacterized protein n=1 Tax=Teratosphaeria nubilosa TaxID=161662 RepID=A0A6G1L2I1_9PEZI|nr:hypothetical protein EJ03DRAFT_376732 [Teratosphaeria nubilosa]
MGIFGLEHLRHKSPSGIQLDQLALADTSTGLTNNSVQILNNTNSTKVPVHIQATPMSKHNADRQLPFRKLYPQPPPAPSSSHASTFTSEADSFDDHLHTHPDALGQRTFLLQPSIESLQTASRNSRLAANGVGPDIDPQLPVQPSSPPTQAHLALKRSWGYLVRKYDGLQFFVSRKCGQVREKMKGEIWRGRWSGGMWRVSSVTEMVQCQGA